MLHYGCFPRIFFKYSEELLRRTFTKQGFFLTEIPAIQYGSPNEYLIPGLESLCILALLKQMPIDSTIYLIFEISIFNWLLLKIPIQIIAIKFSCNN